jgi:phosphomannomutase
MTPVRKAPLPPMRLRPGLQRYVWGDTSFIPALLGLSGVTGPCAEAWFGAHAALPALLEAPAGVVGLDAAIAADPVRVLGEGVAGRFAGLPYLIKILAAARPLSIQVHPNRSQAAAGFARENAAGIPLAAPRRTYRDPSHKPELIVALTAFDALCGFRAPAELAALVDRLPELGDLLPGAENRPLLDTVRAYLDRPTADVAPALARLDERLRGENARTPFPSEDPAHWFLVAAREHGYDRGLAFLFLLELVHLEPGQGLFVPAGVVHAYLCGAGVEIMASSDNVVRGGLTGKHVDVDELFRITDFDARRPALLSPGADGSYATDSEEFRLSCIELPGAGSERAASAEGPETLIVVRGGLVLEAAGRTLELARGAACLVPAGTHYRLRATGASALFRAEVPAQGFRGRQPAQLAFGTSGLRGLVTDITDVEAYINARGFLAYLVRTGQARPGTPVATGGDLRPSTARILRAVARAIDDAGFTAASCGELPTPTLTYHGIAEGWPSIMVTGSHIPFDRNGIKFNKPAGEVLKEDEAAILDAIARVRREVYAAPAAASPFADDGSLGGAGGRLPAPSPVAAARYLERYLGFLPRSALAGLRVAFYEHSAVGRELVPELLRALGATVLPVGRSPGFVALDTEAISDATLAELEAHVRALGPVDAVVSTDGDSDRPLLVVPDATGRLHFCGGDRLGLLVADLLGADAIAVPVSSTDAIERHFAGRPVAILRTRIGSPYVISALAAMTGRRKVGWEANGGFLVGSELEVDGRRLAPLPTRDAVLPLVVTLAAAARSKAPARNLLARLPRRFSHAGLLDAVPVELSRALVRRLTPIVEPGCFEVDLRQQRFAALRATLARTFPAELGFGAPERLNFLDGVRVALANGDVAHVRPSGNAPQLRLYALADSEERARAIVALGLAEPGGFVHELLRASRGG